MLMDLMQFVNMLVPQNGDADAGELLARAVAAGAPAGGRHGCPGLNYATRGRWWTPRTRGIGYASLCDECYSAHRDMDDFAAVSTTNRCFCDGYLYGNRGGKNGQLNVAFWNRSMTRYYNIRDGIVEIPECAPFYISIHADLDIGQAYKYEVCLDDKVIVPYGDDYYYGVTVVSLYDAPSHRLKRYHVVRNAGIWTDLPGSFLLHNDVIRANSKLTVNIRIFSTVEKRFYKSSDTFVGAYGYHNGLLSISDTAENEHMAKLRTNHLGYSVTRSAFKDMMEISRQPISSSFGFTLLPGSNSQELLDSCVRSYRDAATKRIRYLQISSGPEETEEVRALKAALARLDSDYYAKSK